MPQLQVEDDVYDALRAGDGLTIDQLIDRTGHKRQDVRAALMALIQRESGAYMVGVENRRRVYGAK